MKQQRAKDCSRENVFEEFRILRNSDYWPCLLPKTQEDILVLLAKRDGENFAER